MAGGMFGRNRIPEAGETDENGKREERAAESFRLQSEMIRKAGFVILEEVVFVHTDERILP